MFRSLVLILVVSAALTAAAQEIKGPILVDEFEKVGCCDFRGRLDAFFSELAINPNDVGLIVTAGPRDDEVRKVVREEMIRSHVLLRNFSAGRLRFVRTDGALHQTKLFRLPIGSPMPELSSVNNTYAMEIEEPTRLLVDYPNGDGGLCPEIEYRQVVALFLAANSTSRAKVVLRGYGSRDATNLERDLLKYFVKDSELDHSRIQFTRGSMLARDADFGPAIEYWLLP